MAEEGKVGISEAFLKLHQYLRKIVERKVAVGATLSPLPVTAPQLALIAESSEEFIHAAADLWDMGRPEDWKSREEWFKEAKFAAKYPISELLKRSGYYHGVLQNEGPERFYEAVKDRVPPDEREIIILHMIEGWSFPVSRFEINGIAVERLSPERLQEVGLQREICEDFFPSESIDFDEYSKYWFLVIKEHWPTGYNYDNYGLVYDGRENSADAEIEQRPAPRPLRFTKMQLEEMRARGKMTGPGDHEISAGFFASGFASRGDLRLPSYLETIAALSLYSPKFFEIPITLVCEPNWRRIRVRESYRREEDAFKIHYKKWKQFESWLNLCARGLEKAKGSRPVMTAIRRYLLATFASGDALLDWTPTIVNVEIGPQLEGSWPHPGRENRPDALEDALLHYAFLLEALFTGEEREGIGLRLSTISALLVGQYDAERVAIRKLVRNAYGARSDLVHGRDVKTGCDIETLRRLCQRVLAFILYYFATEPAPNLDALVNELLVSRAAQAKVEGMRGKVFSLLADGGSLAD